MIFNLWIFRDYKVRHLRLVTDVLWGLRGKFGRWESGHFPNFTWQIWAFSWFITTSPVCKVTMIASNEVQNTQKINIILENFRFCSYKVLTLQCQRIYVFSYCKFMPFTVKKCNLCFANWYFQHQRMSKYCLVNTCN